MTHLEDLKHIVTAYQADGGRVDFYTKGDLVIVRTHFPDASYKEEEFRADDPLPFQMMTAAVEKASHIQT